MARPKSRDTETITFRLPKETKERIRAAGLRYADLDRASEVNVSEFVREVLEEWLGQFEAQHGGQEVLAARLLSARQADVQDLIEQLGP